MHVISGTTAASCKAVRQHRQGDGVESDDHYPGECVDDRQLPEPVSGQEAGHRWRDERLDHSAGHRQVVHRHQEQQRGGNGKRVQRGADRHAAGA